MRCESLARAAADRLAAAQDYPTKPVRVIIPFPPGAINDTVGRLIATQLSNRLGKQFVVDNRAGAGGVVGTELAANAPKDGYTLLIVSLVNTVNPWLYKLTYEPIKAFAPIAVARLVAEHSRRQSGAAGRNRCSEFIALARKQPGKVQYASGGVGSFMHLGGELFKLVGRRRSPARAVQGRRPGHDRCGRRPHQRDLRHHPDGHAAGEVRQGPGARRRLGEAAGRAAGRADLRRSRAARLRRSRTGSASSRPPARRRPSSTS